MYVFRSIYSPQVTAALQGQQMSVAVRQASQSPVRIQPSSSTTPLVAVAVQQSGTVQHTQPSNSNDTVSRYTGTSQGARSVDIHTPE